MTLAHQDPGGVHPVTGEPYVPSRIPSTGPHHEPWLLTESEREVFRQRSRHSRAARARALAGLAESAHPPGSRDHTLKRNSTTSPSRMT